MSKVIRIGTRESALALWQANYVGDQLKALGHDIEIVKIKSKGDIVLDKPLYELGITGIFTKTLDIALLQKEIDIAVHSMKDVPTLLPKGISQFAVPERGLADDIVVYKGDKKQFELKTVRTIATGSLRRKAQWLYRYNSDNVTGLRGNVITRLEKLENNPWDGAIFAATGLKRINLLPSNSIVLDWMIPAPGQGALMIAGRSEDNEIKQYLNPLHDPKTAVTVYIEREFLRTLEGGCTAPIGAYAQIIKRQVYFQGVLTSLQGEEQILLEKEIPLAQFENFGKNCAEEILAKGGERIMKEIKAQL